MSEQFEWSTDDRFLSNNGAGPFVAQILCVADGVATMERWLSSRRRSVRFQLPVKYLTSRKCGWRKQS